MIKKLFSFGPRLRLTSQANAFFDRTTNYLLFRRGFEDLIERGISGRLINLLQPQISLESLSADRPLLYSQRGIAMRKARIIQIAILTQAFDNGLDDRFSRAAAFEQACSQFFDRARLGGEQLACALKDARAGTFGIERRRGLGPPALS